MRDAISEGCSSWWSRRVIVERVGCFGDLDDGLSSLVLEIGLDVKIIT